MKMEKRNEDEVEMKSNRKRKSKEERKQTIWVTKGFPSRSPPIQLPIEKGHTSTGRGGCPSLSKAMSKFLKLSGRAAQMFLSTTTSPFLASESGVGLIFLTVFDCHVERISLLFFYCLVDARVVGRGSKLRLVYSKGKKEEARRGKG